MKPAPFDYAAPASLDEALALKAKLGDDAKFLAGGQSLIPALNFRLNQAAWLVDLNGVPGLDTLAVTAAGELCLGAMLRQRQVEHSAEVARHAPLLAEAMPHVAHPQIRNRGTLGGSLAYADPAAELPVLAVALDGRLCAQSARGQRWIDAEAFFITLFTTALEPDEMLVELRLPPLPPRTGTAFLEFARRRGDYAIVGAAAVVGLDDAGHCRSARLVFLNAADRPASAAQAAAQLAGQPITAETAAAAAEHAAAHEIDPLGNVHGTPDYQRHLVRVLGRRALLLAAQRAGRANGSNPA